MPPKKRGAVEAELPPSERARRAMTALVAGLGKTLALLDAAGADPPLPVAGALIDDAVAMLARAVVAVQPARFARIEHEWMPADVLHHILAYASGTRRRVSTFGANGAVNTMPDDNPYNRTQFGRPTPFSTLRLVCKSWTRVAGDLVLALYPRARPKADPLDVFRAFPHARVLYLKKFTDKIWKQIERLIKQYVAQRAPSNFFVDAGWLDAIPIQISGAALHVADRYVHLCEKAGAKYNFSVQPPNSCAAEPVACACYCCESKLYGALSTGYKTYLNRCYDPHTALDIRNAPKFTAPIVRMFIHTLEFFFDHFPALFDAASWLGSCLPIFDLIAYFSDAQKHLVHRLVLLVGTEHIRFCAPGYPDTTIEKWIAEYPAA